MRKQKCSFLLLALVAVAAATGVLLASGCAVEGFQYLPDGLASPGQMRAAANTARSEAMALDAIADQTEAATNNAIGFIQEAAGGLGFGGLAPLLLGGLAGVLIPAPGTKKKEQAMIEAATAGRSG